MNPQDRYRAFAAQHDLPIWQQPWYMDAVCWQGDWTAFFVEKDGKDVVAWPFFVKRKYGLRYVTMPVFTKQMGPIFAPSAQDERTRQKLTSEIIDQLPNWASITQDLPPAVTNWLPWHWAGYRQTTRYTYQLDLSTPDQLLSGLNRNMRRAIRKGDASFHLADGGTIEQAYALQEKSFARQGLPLPYKLPQFLRHDEALQNAQARQLFFAADAAGNLIASSHLIWDQHAAYYHLAGGAPSGRDQQIGIWLTWQAIDWTINNLSVDTFDFAGSMVPGVALIRQQFGARQVPYFRVWRHRHPVFRWRSR